MCWQCAANKPDDYLKIFDSFIPHSWFWGGEAGNGVFEFSLEGETWHTNPGVNFGFAGEVIPGDDDGPGYPWYLPGTFQGEYQSKTKHYR